MQVSHLLFIGWVVIVGFWLLNHFYYENVKYEAEYRKGNKPKH